MPKNTNHNTDAIAELLSKSNECEDTSVNIAIENAQSALQVARSIKHDDYIWQAVMRIGHLMFKYQIPCLKEEDFVEAIQLVQNRRKEADGIGLYLQLATLYRKQARYPESIYHINKSLEISQQCNNTFFTMLSYGHLGNIYYELGEYDLAFEFNQKSLQIAEQEGNASIIQSQLNNIGSLYHKLGRYKDSLTYFEQALEIRRGIGILRFIAYSLNNIGEAYRGLHQYDDAFACLHEALSIAESEKISHLVILCKANISLALEETFSYTEALQYSAEALELAKDSEPIQFVADLKCHLARLYLHLGNYDKAQDLLEQSRVVAIQHLNKDLLTIVYKNFSQVFEKVQDFESAYKWHKLYVETQTSMHSEEKEREIAKQERLLSVKKAEQARLVMEKQLMQSEQNALRTQINPHFLFNSLNSIQSLLAEANTEQALRYMSRFARLMRAILDNSRKASVSLQTELEIYQLYVDIEKLRFQNTFTYIVDIHPDCTIEEMDIPPMIAQPFLENAIWHGLLPKHQDATLTIRVKPFDDDRYIMEVEDNGIGREQSQNNKVKQTTTHTSAGIKIINERLTLLANLLNLKLSCSINDIMETNTCIGTCVSIILPMQSIRL